MLSAEGFFGPVGRESFRQRRAGEPALTGAPGAGGSADSHESVGLLGRPDRPARGEFGGQAYWHVGVIGEKGTHSPAADEDTVLSLHGEDR